MMTALTAKFFVDYFSGTWKGKVFLNGVHKSEIILRYAENNELNASLALGAVIGVVHGEQIQEDNMLSGQGGWRSDTHSWCELWYDKSGAYNELQWTSLQELNGIKVLYGFVHECKEEGDEPAEYIAMCELTDTANFKFTSQSYRRGILEVEASRIGTSKAS